MPIFLTIEKRKKLLIIISKADEGAVDEPQTRQ